MSHGRDDVPYNEAIYYGVDNYDIDNESPNYVPDDDTDGHNDIPGDILEHPYNPELEAYHSHLNGARADTVAETTTTIDDANVVDESDDDELDGDGFVEIILETDDDDTDDEK